MTKRERCLRAKECHEKGLNCGQSVLLAFTDVTGLTEAQSMAAASGFGGGLTAVGLVRLLRVRRLSRDPEKAADYDALLKDERTVYISNKARSMTFFICVFVQVAASMLAILVFDQVLVGQVLCGLTCLQGLLYTVFYWHYDKVY